jgi:hypothetical protein
MKHGHYFFLSNDAFAIVKDINCIEQGDCSKVARNNLSAELKSISGWATIIADVGQINDELAREINLTQQVHALAIGIVPFSADYPERLEALCTPPSAKDGHFVKLAMYSADAEHANEIKALFGSDPRVSFVKPSKSILPSFASGEFDAFAGVTNGRQTFCMFGDSFCLHPGIDNPGESILTPNRLNIKHWFLQSCHSPFVWPDFGNYLSFPIAALLRGNSASFVASTRVQSFIPHILASFTQLALRGMALGEVVLALNRYCSELECDDEPFILFGHPLNQVALPMEHESPLSLRDCVGKEGKPENLRELRALQHLSSNLRFALFRAHFNIKGSPEMNQLRNLAEKLQSEFAKHSRHFRSRASGILPTTSGEKLSVHRQLGEVSVPEVLEQLASVWGQHKGYYYHFSEGIEQNFEPVESAFIGARCSSCSSQLMRKRLRYLGPSPARDYSERIHRICPRCLVVMDVNAREEAAFQLSVLKISDIASTITLSYCNRTDFPQWVNLQRRVNDPNNVSINTAPDVVRELKGSILIDGQPCLDLQTFDHAHWIEPHDTIELTVTVEGRRADLFYILIEFDVFVDGAWNWLSATYRRPTISDWMKSDLYRKTLPKQGI